MAIALHRYMHQFSSPIHIVFAMASNQVEFPCTDTVQNLFTMLP